MKKDFRDAFLEAAKLTGTPLRHIADGAGVSYEKVKSLAQGKARSTSVDDAAKLADYLGTTVDDLISGAYAPADPQPAITGFSDGPVSPYQAAPRVQDLAFNLARLRQSVEHPSLWRIKMAVPGLSLTSGDLLVIDMKRTTPSPGDIVIVQFIDLETGDAETHLRQYLPPYLTDGTAGTAHKIDPDTSTIMGTVCATIRLPD